MIFLSIDISTIIENTAFVADLGLHFPKIFHKIYDKGQPAWKTLLESSIDLTLKSGLIDNETSKAVSLVNQKKERFFNAYTC